MLPSFRRLISKPTTKKVLTPPPPTAHSSPRSRSRTSAPKPTPARSSPKKQFYYQSKAPVPPSGARSNSARDGDEVDNERLSSQGRNKLLPHEKARPAVVLERFVPEIVLEDESLVVVNKPCGIAIQGQHGSTARRSWDAYLEDLKARPDSPEVFPAHRLDKATTGCLVLAKSALQAKKLGKQFQAHQVERTYIAIVHGSITSGYQGEITTRLRTDEDCVRSCEGEEEGSPALTRWECLATSPTHSLLRLEPSTGRKHQLRVHCAESLQASIVGDFKYAMHDPHRQGLFGFPPDTIMLHSLGVRIWTWNKSGKRSTISAAAKPPHVFERFCTVANLEFDVDEIMSRPRLVGSVTPGLDPPEEEGLGVQNA